MNQLLPAAADRFRFAACSFGSAHLVFSIRNGKEAFLKIVPPALRAAFEFRHASWFDEEVYSILRSHNATLCIAQSERLTTPPVLTADFGYLRLRREDYAAADRS